MNAYRERNVQTPDTPPSADAGGEATKTDTTEPTTDPPSRNATRPSVGCTITHSCSSHDPSHRDTFDPPCWQMIEYRHKDCDICHAFIAFNSRFTTDLNNHYEKVAELALNTINVFHEGSPIVQSVDVSSHSEKETTRLAVEVTASTVD
ncbi:hypothetical protein INS49_006203 [Diaporthe citri]|uniref:uncharacterized protein n=1 Tax=Diaporthe citri TaxID=83186 RepID=UPI001C81340F|nr:uncharacterized protein INS49_006203 [Diaporthe citri]KAG6364601.1 hypothetical protein INS49_006203 [Diaporthe citri]